MHAVHLLIIIPYAHLLPMSLGIHVIIRVSYHCQLWVWESEMDVRALREHVLSLPHGEDAEPEEVFHTH